MKSSGNLVLVIRSPPTQIPTVTAKSTHRDLPRIVDHSKVRLAHCKNVRGLGKSKVVFCLFEKLNLTVFTKNRGI